MVSIILRWQSGVEIQTGQFFWTALTSIVLFPFAYFISLNDRIKHHILLAVIAGIIVLVTIDKIIDTKISEDLFFTLVTPLVAASSLSRLATISSIAEVDKENFALTFGFFICLLILDIALRTIK